MDIPSEPLINFWYRALHSPYGIAISVSDATAVRMKLYAERRLVQDLDLEQIAVCVSPFDPGKLWLVKRKPKDAQTGRPTDQ